MIAVQNISYEAGKKKILKGISFEAPEGQLLAVIGANGAGKSTLMKLLCREINAASGSILFNGKNITSYSLKELARLRAVLTQHNTVSIRFTVQELVLMGRYPYFDNMPSKRDMEVIDQVMEETGIMHLTGRDYNTLSGGEQQRVQLARVIAQIYDQPDAFLFLDEPTNGLDLLYQQQILQLARSLSRRGYTVVSILHDINFASQYADKILILKNGKTVAWGTPSEVINCDTIHEAFNVRVQMMNADGFNCPLIIPGGSILV